uniref:Ubiquitin-like domain-containing protein n=1 Tax=Entamoeba invadens TaxID=33085 RepID=S0B0F4_ENTIV|nr:hypothetical protein, conserved [Entamoeba invadens]
MSANRQTMLFKALSALTGLKIVGLCSQHPEAQKIDLEMFTNLFVNNNIEEAVEVFVENNNRERIVPEIHPNEPTFKIYINNSLASNKIFSIDISSNWSTEKVQQVIFDKTGIPSDLYYLVFRGRILDEGINISEYYVTEECTLFMVGKLRGGLKESAFDGNLLSPSYDYDFTGIDDVKDGRTYTRGGKNYSRPCGYMRYALNVLGKYDDGDDTWLGMSNSKGEWAVSYHGTDPKFADSICKNGFKVGDNNAYGDGVYCSPCFETAASYSKDKIDDEGNKFKIVFQNRVKTDEINYADKKRGPSDYWYMDPKNIRPYGICIIKLN